MDDIMKSKQHRNEAGFTLIELLIVVAILAIVAGGMVLAYDGVETQARKSQASRDIAAIDQAVRVFVNKTNGLPNNLDSVIVTTPVAPDPVANTAGITAGDATFVAPLSPTLNDADTAPEKLLTYPLTAADVTALNAAGILQLRYMDLAGNSDACAVPCALTVPAANGTAATVGNISQIDIPSHMFDVPREGGNRNRGRGFSHPLAATDVVAMWYPGQGGINLSKIGAIAGDLQGTTDDGAATGTSTYDVAEYGTAADRVVVFGLGNMSTMYAQSSTNLTNVNIANAPTYPDVGKAQYPRYLLLVNLGPAGTPLAKARLLGVVDSKGDFLDEELAEASGQKT